MIALLVLAIALAMDAFAVSVVRGSVRAHRTSEGLRIAAAFGLAQGLMPLIGWWLGIAFASTFKQIDHWIAFVLLSGLGVRMIKEGLSAEQPREQDRIGTALLGLIVAAFATSIDAAAAGITLPLLGVAVPLACLTIGATTAVICFIGYQIGGKVSLRVGKWAEALGGVILIALGSRILVQHVFFDG
jgi:putative Mn2+ efflux pump MntP